MARRPRLLVVDDKPNFLALFRRVGEPELEVLVEGDAMAALGLLGREPVDVIISDVRLPGMNGIELLHHVRHRYPHIDVILMTAFVDVADAVRAIKAGAFHYLTKPFDPDVALALVREALAKQQRGASNATGQPTGLIAASQAMQAALDLIVSAATLEVPVLVTGEVGTGKLLVAEEIHARSGRAERRFIALHCASLTAEGLVEAARRARGGTLCLEEIWELPPPAQAMLLAIMQQVQVQPEHGDHPSNVRLVPTARPFELERRMQEATFREDLFYRLNVVSIRVPTLRERRGDIAPLADAILARMTPRVQGRLMISSDTRAVLEGYAWPGNVRQLENALAHAVAATSAGTEILPSALPEEIRSAAETVTEPVDLATLPYREVLAHSRDQSSKEYLIALLKSVQGNVTQAAERAGLERESLHRLLKRYGLRAEDFRAK